MLESKLIDMLRCPIDGSHLQLLTDDEISRVNLAIESGNFRDRLDQRISCPLDAGLLNRQANRVYPVRGGIPSLVADECGEEKLKALFGKYGDVETVFVYKPRPGDASASAKSSFAYAHANRGEPNRRAHSACATTMPPRDDESNNKNKKRFSLVMKLIALPKKVLLNEEKNEDDDDKDEDVRRR